MSAKEFPFEKGQEVYDNVHEMKGVVVQIVPMPEDRHHDTYYVVCLEDGRKVNLTEGQIV